MRRRFFVEQFTENGAVMEGEAAHHLGRVLRAQAGQLYELSDGQRVFLGRIEIVGRDRIEFALVEELPAIVPVLDVTLLLAVVKFDAFEWALEKATELGVRVIVPVAAARSEKSLITSAAKRAERWRRILMEASQQSRRVSVPVLRQPEKSAVAFAARKSQVNILLSEQPTAKLLRLVLQGSPPGVVSEKAALAIGPEGGWTEEEFAAACAAGFQEASLGPSILRTETAVIAALASLNFAFSR